MYDMTQAWTEAGATWNTYDGTNNWPGARAATPTRKTTVLASFVPLATGLYTANLNASGVTALQSWVTTPANNKGFMINEGATTDGMDFDSKEATTVANRPKLTLTYCPRQRHRRLRVGRQRWRRRPGRWRDRPCRRDGEPAQELRQTALVQSTTTSATGFYGFGSVPTGNYYVEFVAPASYSFTLQDQGGDDTKDSDANPADGKTIAFAWTSGGAPDTKWDAGLIQPIIGDFVWNDTDHDGIQDTGEAGLANVYVRLLDATTLAPVLTALTDASGKYVFSNPPTGNYYVEFYAPQGYVFSPKDATGDTADSDADPATGRTTALISWTFGGSPIASVDAGMYDCSTCAAILGNQVWSDLDGDGLYDSTAASPNQEFPGGDITVHLWWVGTDNAPGGGDDAIVQTTHSTRAAPATISTTFPMGSTTSSSRNRAATSSAR